MSVKIGTVVRSRPMAHADHFDAESFDADLSSGGSSCCGVASLSIVLSACKQEFVSEDSTFALFPIGLTVAKQPVELAVRKNGLTLQELGHLADNLPGVCNAWPVTHANALGGVDEMRQVLRAALDAHRETRTCESANIFELSKNAVYPLVNYHMGTLGQRPWAGHISPIAGYHAASDSFLVLDVWFHSDPVRLHGLHHPHHLTRLTVMMFARHDIHPVLLLLFSYGPQACNCLLQFPVC
eukprot:SAG31_NODE_442_length_15661_cov_4.132245_7_plen_240_part_00